ncbi:MAG: hypothetical protein JXC32_13565 [Anaerolineae bacterium]|nr:hypothetical protein [Anaerolineae bacterium]
MTTHRLSTIRSADKIIALENGYNREIGDHEDLLSRDRLYSQRYQRRLELTKADSQAENDVSACEDSPGTDLRYVGRLAEPPSENTSVRP